MLVCDLFLGLTFILSFYHKNGFEFWSKRKKGIEFYTSKEQQIHFFNIRFFRDV